MSTSLCQVDHFEMEETGAINWQPVATGIFHVNPFAKHKKESLDQYGWNYKNRWSFTGVAQVSYSSCLSWQLWFLNGINKWLLALAFWPWTKKQPRSQEGSFYVGKFWDIFSFAHVILSLFPCFEISAFLLPSFPLFSVAITLPDLSACMDCA